MRGSGPFAGVAVEVGQELVAELLQLDEQVVGRGHVGHDAHTAALLVGELGPLVEHMHAVDFRASNKEELLVLIGGQLLEAFMEEQGADGIAPRLTWLPSILFDNPVKAREKIVGPPDFGRRGARCPFGRARLH